MKIAFVGVKRKYKELPEDYKDTFDAYHLELPWYYAKFGGNDVLLTTVDIENEETVLFPSTGGILRRVNELEYRNRVFFKKEKYDVIVHFRRWHEELFDERAVNLMVSQDHSYDAHYVKTIHDAHRDGKLHSVICFESWHEEYIQNALSVPTISGVSLGVDTDIYKPHPIKKTRTMLWASDPGRGIHGAIKLAIELFRRDKRYSMDVLWPDYVKTPISIVHPAINVVKNLRNGPTLWNYFNSAGIVPYTSTFPEPSSRAHRQGQAAGCMVLYPPDMGTPSRLIRDGDTGFVRPIEQWADIIQENVENGNQSVIGRNAHLFAVSENWEVQAKNFNKKIGALI